MKCFPQSLNAKYENVSRRIKFLRDCIFPSIPLTSLTATKFKLIRSADISQKLKEQLVEYFLELILVYEVTSSSSFSQIFLKFIHFFDE